MKFTILLGLAAIFAVSFGASPTLACSCDAGTPTVLEAFAASPIVMTVKLEEFEELDRSMEGGNIYRTMAAVMTVEKVYKGAVKANERIRVLDGSGGECSIGFLRQRIGQRFLLYTDPARQIGKLRGKLYWISRCSRSETVESAAPDLVYLDDRAALTGKTRLSGTVKRFSQDPPSLAGIKIAVTGKNFERVIETDENGFFDIWGLPPGQYIVAFHPPGGTRVSAYKLAPDRTWRREIARENAVQATVPLRKHVELIVGLDTQTAGGR
jgi:hypothetical protein